MKPVAIHWKTLVAVAAVCMLMHLMVINRYGYFRDELYYIACAEHLDWGYVDHPPLSVAVLKVFITLLGTDLWVIRLPGTLIAIGITLLYGAIAARLGGDRLAQGLAAVFGGFTPVVAVVTHHYSMNGLEILLWAAAVLVWLSADEPAKRSRWLWLGVLCGLTLLNKLSGSWLLVGIGLATLLTPRRQELKGWQPWAALAIAGVLFAPHMLWQIQHQFPTEDFIRNATEHKMTPIPPWVFLGVQVMVTSPMLALMWIMGGYSSLSKKEWRMMAIPFFMVLLLLLVSQRSRENYLSPAFAFVAPVGAIVLAAWLSQARWRGWLYGGLMVPTSGFSLSMALPVWPPDLFIQIVKQSPVPIPMAERGPSNYLLGHADTFGWPEMAARVRAEWLALPEEERLRTPVMGMNYGESSAIWFFNRDLPEMKVIGRHNNFWHWGPGDWDGRSLIVVGQIKDWKRDSFESHEIVGRMDHPYAVPEEATAPISIARGLKIPVEEFWAKIRHFQ